MITKNIRDQIEYQFGKKIRYPKDCFALANDIAKKCNENISPATLMRLFGLTKNNSHPRLFTLDVIAQYCGHCTWEDFIDNSNIEDLHQPNIKSINSDESTDLKIKMSEVTSLKKMMIFITENNELAVSDSELSQIKSRKFVDPLIIKNAYLFILDSLEKNATGILIKVDAAKLYPI